MNRVEIAAGSLPLAGAASPRLVWRRTRSRLAPLAVIAILPLAGAPSAGQAPPAPPSAEACAAIDSDAERLACYDRLFAPGRTSGEPELASGTDAPEVGERSGAGFADAEPDASSSSPASLLDRRWELSAGAKRGTFGLRAYQPIYVLPWVGASEVNQSPSSPAPDHTVESPDDLDGSELKFQLSWKSKAWQGVFGERGDLWIAYTQSSRWQLFNEERSRPFRETNYEPELLLVFATDYRIFGWSGRLLSVGLNHESNGRDRPRSRGWNRLTASVGFERDGWTFTVRPWWRIPESAAADDNPDIEDYIGRADVRLIRHVRNHELALMLRHSLRGGEQSHGAAQIDWAFPLRGNLRGHVQLFHGYGESLIDYNFETTRIGLGLSLIEWY